MDYILPMAHRFDYQPSAPACWTGRFDQSLTMESVVK